MKTLTRYLLHEGVRYTQEMTVLEEKKDRIFIDPVMRAPYDRECVALWQAKSNRRFMEGNAIHYVFKDRIGQVMPSIKEKNPSCEVILQGTAEETAQRAGNILCQYCEECLKRADAEYARFRERTYKGIDAAYAPAAYGRERKLLHLLSCINTLAKETLSLAPDEFDCSRSESEIYGALSEIINTYPDAVQALHR